MEKRALAEKLTARRFTAGRRSELQVVLRQVVPSDLPVFFKQQLDAEAHRMAAFTSGRPTDRTGFNAHWNHVLADPEVVTRTIIVSGKVAGYIAQFEMFGQADVGYWIGRAFWGKGVATAALASFVRQLPTRPLHARAAKDNYASIRVLEKCGFQICGEERSFAKARGEEIDEVVYVLTAAD